MQLPHVPASRRMSHGDCEAIPEIGYMGSMQDANYVFHDIELGYLRTPSMMTLSVSSLACLTTSKASKACSNLNLCVMSLRGMTLPEPTRFTASG